MNAEETQLDVEAITYLVAKRFPSFGGDKKVLSILDAAMDGKPASFAMGVHIKDVVETVLRLSGNLK